MENDYNKFLFSVKKVAIAGIFVLVFQKFSMVHFQMIQKQPPEVFYKKRCS